ncbi:hypothetical protein SLEP1_g45082 [Rubroshorea leprosula]|uniref:Uncharacterized protein n=1 Tax=Rubroshorea leprosula TaxID=152421 RepID=A0AAV5LJH6_9ROSI|nr:hypothetical protein SLEP1_g45082 [Rubroshorea leprosula]
MGILVKKDTHAHIKSNNVSPTGHQLYGDKEASFSMEMSCWILRMVLTLLRSFVKEINRAKRKDTMIPT